VHNNEQNLKLLTASLPNQINSKQLCKQPDFGSSRAASSS